MKVFIQEVLKMKHPSEVELNCKGQNLPYFLKLTFLSSVSSKEIQSFKIISNTFLIGKKSKGHINWS